MKTAEAKSAKGITSLDGKRTISVEEFDRLFDEGSDEIDQFIDLNNAKIVSPTMTKATKVNVDFPAWVVAALDRQAERIGVARQALIKLWIAERLEKLNLHQQRARVLPEGRASVASAPLKKKFAITRVISSGSATLKSKPAHNPKAAKAGL